MYRIHAKPHSKDFYEFLFGSKPGTRANRRAKYQPVRVHADQRERTRRLRQSGAHMRVTSGSILNGAMEAN